MAALSTLSKSALTLRYKEGVDGFGKDIIKGKKFPNLKASAVAQNIYDVSTAFGALMKYPIQEILRSDDNVITNE